ncbi:MAG: DUF4296 domain-containing protein [Bacteroidales bacterium]|nr:DUF4296 domain-containing protein [Bacteroidales bacterium]
MRKSVLLLLMTVLVFSGCYQNHKLKEKKPANLIPENKMADIIRDMDIITSIVSYRRSKGQVKPTEKEYYQAMFEHYQVTAQQVRSSMDYYYDHQEMMNRIYEKVLADLSLKQSVANLEKGMKENKFLDQNGLHNYQYQSQWLYPDSIRAYDFKPVF